MRNKKNCEQFTCRIESEVIEKLKRNVLDYDLPSMNDYINDCLKFSLENMEIGE